MSESKGLYRIVMRIAHRYDWHYAPPIYPEGDTQLWCKWCGLRQTVKRAEQACVETEGEGMNENQCLRAYMLKGVIALGVAGLFVALSALLISAGICLLISIANAQVTIYNAAGRKLGPAAGSLRLLPTSTPTKIATAAPTARPTAFSTPLPSPTPSAAPTPVSVACMPIPAPIPGSGLTFASPVNMQTVSGMITVSYNITDPAIIATELGVDGQLSGLRDGYASVPWDTTGKTYGLPLANGCHQLQVIGLDWLHRVIGNQFIDVIVAN